MKNFIHTPLFWGVSAIGLGVVVYLSLFVFGVHTLFYDIVVIEPFSDKGKALVSSGSFHDVVHSGQKGVARVYRQEDGSHLLRLENLEIDNGPALHVYVISVEDAHDNDTVKKAESIDLGPLRGNRGNQTYQMPDHFHPDQFRTITIWCRRFGVNFASAPLKPQSP